MSSDQDAPRPVGSAEPAAACNRPSAANRQNHAGTYQPDTAASDVMCDRSRRKTPAWEPPLRLDEQQPQDGPPLGNIMQSPSRWSERQRPHNDRGRPCGHLTTPHIPLLRISAPLATE